MTEWISVEETLPVPGERVIIATRWGFVGEGFLAKDGWSRYVSDIDIEDFLGRVTHWMPMPEGPKEGK